MARTCKWYETCTISRITTDYVCGEQVKTETIVYANIPCYYHWWGSSLTDNLSEKTDVRSTHITIDISNEDIQQADLVDVVWYGRYIIQSFKKHRPIRWIWICGGNIELYVTKH